MQHKSSAPCLVTEMYPGMQLIGTTPLKKTNNGPVLQQCVQKMWNRLKEGRGCWTRHLLTLDQALSWLFEELQLDEVMVFVAKLVTFLVVCGICSVTTVAVGQGIHRALRLLVCSEEGPISKKTRASRSTCTPRKQYY